MADLEKTPPPPPPKKKIINKYIHTQRCIFLRSAQLCSKFNEAREDNVPQNRIQKGKEINNSSK